ncbi:MAG: Gfo/Idh/MocA family oxidoreductase [Acidobacteriota bacterium]|nr:Gfo/Idh/MocA family oxidoreductase [Acidobacteriota bacterium]
MTQSNNDRRSFLKGAASASLMTAASYENILGANDRVRVGCIGIGLIGKRHLLDFLSQPDCEIAAISELYDPRLTEGIETAAEKQKTKPEGFKDFRRMLDSKNIDAVVVSTPDHWHALMTILACAAGKDVYVEKPLTLFIDEGRWMIEAEKRYKRVVQVGTQQRSGKQYAECVDLIRNQHIGEMRSARLTSFRNISPGFTKPVGTQPMSETDWQMWLGPAPYTKFDPNRCIYHFRWFWDYSGGQTTNLMAHNIDIVQWATGAKPKSVAAMGGRYSLTGLGETPDVVEAIIEFPGFLTTWSCREMSAGQPGAGSTSFFGTKGMLRIERSGMEVIPDRMIPAENLIPSFTAPRTVTQNPEPRTQAIKREGFEQVRDQFVPHVRNFLDSIKSRQPTVSNLQTSQQTNITTHLVNIAQKLKRTINWDADRETIVGDKEAARLMSKEYRAPWDKELKAALSKTS